MRSRMMACALTTLLLARVRPPAPDAAERDAPPRWGTGSLMLVVEREAGSVLVFDASRHELLGRVRGLGNLTHATIKFSKDGRYAYVLGRESRGSWTRRATSSSSH